MAQKTNVQFTGERVVEHITPARIWLDHITRYKFAGKYVKGKSVLDLACGTGYGSKYLYDIGAAKVVGVDISNETIDFARDQYQGRGLTFEVGNIEHIDFPSNNFDIITCFETIEHVLNAKNALMELKRVLKPKGLVIISSPNRRLTSRGKSINDHPDNSFHTKEYLTKEFISVLENYFSVLEVYGQRSVNKVFFWPFFKKIFNFFGPFLYDSTRGNPELEIVSCKKEYRYITAVCEKNES